MSEYPSICALCKFAKKMKDKNFFGCPHFIIVNYDNTCDRFEIDYLKIEPKRPIKKVFKQFSTEDFSIDD